MATKRKVKEDSPEIIGACRGGRSWQFKQDPHKPGKIKDIYCYRCKTRMGCSFCCEKARELLCLECHNWATKTAMRYHGNIVPNPKVPRVRTDEGWIRHEATGPYGDPVASLDARIEKLLKDIPF
jgi:hypothetical protein